MKWILFYQTPNDRVRFITDESTDPTSLAYTKFCQNILSYPIKRAGDLQVHIDTFHTIYLNIETGEWNQELPEKENNVSFEQMTKLNPSIEEQRKQEDLNKDREVTLIKQYFDKKWEDKRNDLFKKYGKDGK